MKKLFALIFFFYALSGNAQNKYTITTTTQTYTRLSATTTLVNRAWTDFEKAVKIPFPFKLFNNSFVDSFYIDDWGTISFDNNYYGDISFIYDDLNSRGMDKSEVSYKVEGVTPNRIFKLQYNNASLYVDSPMFRDSLNVQAWLYETSNIIEFRYGTGAVATADWFGAGPYVALFDPVVLSNFIILEGNPANPTVNTTDDVNSVELNGLPANGTVYRFTPSSGTGINSVPEKITIIHNKISLPPDLIVKEIRITTLSGQVIQTAISADEINLTKFSHGVYIVRVETESGMFSRKLVL